MMAPSPSPSASRLLLAFACLIACTIAFTATFTAAQPPGAQFLKYEDLRDELRARPFDANIRDQVAEALRRTMDIYTFKDISKDAAKDKPKDRLGYPCRHDVMEEIEKVAAMTFSSHIEMEEAFARIFLPLNDAHTAYHKNYTESFTLPLRLHVKTYTEPDSDHVVQRLFIEQPDSYLALYKSVYGYCMLENATLPDGSPADLWSMDGFEVVSIDHYPSLSLLWELSLDGHFNGSRPHHAGWRPDGMSRDAQIRFNLATHGFGMDGGPLQPPGWFSYRKVSTYPIPHHSTVVLGVAPPPSDPSQPKPTEPSYYVPIQWVGMKPPPRLAAASRLALNADELKSNPAALRQAVKSSTDLYRQRFAVDEEEWRMVSDEIDRRFGPTKLSTSNSRPSNHLYSESIPGLISFDIQSDNTALLQIKSFSPSDEATMASFLNLIQNGITSHQRDHEGKDLLIDVRSNGGGDICLGYTVLRFLFPSIVHPPLASFDPSSAPFGRYDTVTAPLTKKLADIAAKKLQDGPGGNYPCGFFSPCGWINPVTQLPFNNISWYNSGRMLERGGVKAEYTALFHDACSDYYSHIAPPDINPGYKPDNVVILSDGLCGSTCAVFTSYIQQNHLGKVVMVGGMLDTAILAEHRMPPFRSQAFSFPGGQVSQIGFMRTMAAIYDLPMDDPNLPADINLATGAIVTFTLREIYPWDDHEGQYPLEFTFLPADFQLGYATNNSFDAQALYQQVKEAGILKASTCVAGLTDLKCEVEHGSGLFDCIGGVIGDTCVSKICNAGYHLKNGECVACEKGTYRESDPLADQTTCSPCPPPDVSVRTSSSSSCSGRFTAEAQETPRCAYEYVCDGDAPISKSTFAIIIIVASLLIIALTAGMIITIRKLRAARSIDINTHFERL